MTVDEVFALREQMQEILSPKLTARKAASERRLQMFNQQSSSVAAANPSPP
jgi:hypothetical protein